MAAQPERSSVATFGPFELDLDSGELRKLGVRVRLSKQPLQILAALLNRPGEIVTREQLCHELWNGDTFVDFEHGLNAATNKLRQALGDSAENPRYVETVPGRGYRFVGSSRRSPGVAASANGHGTAGETFQPRPVSAIWVKLTAAGAALAACVIAGYFAGSRRIERVDAQPIRYTIAPPAGYVLEPASSRQGIAVSPDGARVAFTAMNADGAFTAWVREFNSLASQPVANSQGVHTMFWAPDSRTLFLSVRGVVRRSTLDGSSFQVLCDAPALMLGGAWLPPDRVMLTGRVKTGVVSASGGVVSFLNRPLLWAQMLPDNQHVLYSEFDRRISRYRGRVVRSGDTGPGTDLVESDSRVMYAPSVRERGAGHLMYVRAGNLLAQPFDASSRRVAGDPVPIAGQVSSFLPSGAADFSVSDNGVLVYMRYTGRSQLAWVDREGRQTGTIGPDNALGKSGRISPDGRYVAAPKFDVERSAHDIWLFETGSDAGRRLVSGPGMAGAPVWSPDSRRIAFLRAVGGPPTMFVRGLGEKDLEEALPPGYFQIPTDWSPDGRFIAYMNTGFPRVPSEASADVWVIDLKRQPKAVPLLNSRFHETMAAFSPDGKWLAFLSDESARTEVYLQAFEAGDSPRVTGERLVVSRHGAVGLRWRPDGKELFYLGTDGRLYAVPIALSAKPAFGPPIPLFTISTEARAVIHSGFGFDVSRDGKRFLVPTAPSGGPSLIAIQNWEAALLKGSM